MFWPPWRQCDYLSRADDATPFLGCQALFRALRVLCKPSSVQLRGTNTNALNPVTPSLLRRSPSPWGKVSTTCHPERSEGSGSSETQILCRVYTERSECAQNDTLLNASVLVCVNLAMADLRRNDARVGKPRGGEAPWGTLVCTCGGRRPFSELVRRNYKRLVEQMSRCKELTWAFRFIFWSIGVKPSREAKGEILN